MPCGVARLLSRSLALLALGITAVNAQTVDRPEELAIDIFMPEENEHFWLEEANVELGVHVFAPEELDAVIAEASGPDTGVFFALCGEEAEPCEGRPPDYEFFASVPVFEGENRLVVRVRDRAGNSRTETRTIQVNLRSFSGSTGAGDRERYDLLILTHKKPGGEDFVAALQPLVQHKNATGMPAKLVTLEEIYEIPALRGHDHPEIIKRAIARAKLRWGVKYVMLVGDSDRFPVRYMKLYDLGHWGHGFAPSDLYYADLFKSDGSFDSWDKDGDHLYAEGQGNFPASAQDLNQDDIDLKPDVAVGRLPVSNLAELKTYVQKVIDYETTVDPSWFKRALLVSGNYPWSNSTSDANGTQLASRGFTLDKQYHDAVWPTTNISQRWAIIENALDNGVGFFSYVGHGAGTRNAMNGGELGGWYHHFRIAGLANQKRLPIIFAAACETAEFHYGIGPYFAKQGYRYQSEVSPPKYRWAPEPISYSPSAYDKDALAEHFLVRGAQGAIAYIGAYTGTQGESHTLSRNFFKAYAGGADIIGDAWNKAITDFVNNTIASFSFPGDSWYTYARWHHIHKMLLFGDPSLRIGGVQPDLRPVAVDNDNYCTIRNDRLLVRIANTGSGTAGQSKTKVDFMQYGQTSLATPALAQGQHHDLLVPIPSRCHDPDCNFVIEADQNGDVAESDETNNSVVGICPG
jgi:hypothetical protein